MKKNYKCRKFEAGVSLVLVSMLLISGMSLVSGINVRSPTFSGGLIGDPLTPHPIWGYAKYCNGGWAVNADVAVHTDDDEVDPEDQTVYTKVGSGGAWSVDVGCPGPCWPDGADFIVWINGTGDYDGWQNISYGNVSGYSNDMGTLILYPPELVANASYEDGCYISGDSVQFYGDASGGASPYDWSWDFDDGGTSSEQDPVHQFDDNLYLILSTKNGLVKKTLLNDYANIRATGIIAQRLRDNDVIVGAKITDGTKGIVLATKKGKAIRFPEKEVRVVGRSSIGVLGIRLNKDDHVVDMAIAEKKKTLLTVCENGYGKRSADGGSKTECISCCSWNRDSIPSKSRR